jgi:hypothetical protein
MSEVIVIRLGNMGSALARALLETGLSDRWRKRQLSALTWFNIFLHNAPLEPLLLTLNQYLQSLIRRWRKHLR